MARTISLTSLTGEPTHVELFDHTYVLREPTRSVQKRLEQAQGKLEGIDEEDTDAAIGLMVDMLDVMLEPNGTGGPAAKKLLMDAWKKDQLSVRQIRLLTESLQEAATERPT